MELQALEVIELANGALWITDDEAIISILKRRGALENFTPVLGASFIVEGWESQAAYCAAFRDYGHFKPEDNGYTMFIFPKTRFTGEQAKAEIDKMTTNKRNPGAVTLNAAQVFAGGN